MGQVAASDALMLCAEIVAHAADVDAEGGNAGSEVSTPSSKKVSSPTDSFTKADTGLMDTPATEEARKRVQEIGSYLRMRRQEAEKCREQADEQRLEAEELRRRRMGMMRRAMQAPAFAEVNALRWDFVSGKAAAPVTETDSEDRYCADAPCAAEARSVGAGASFVGMGVSSAGGAVAVCPVFGGPDADLDDGLHTWVGAEATVDSTIDEGLAGCDFVGDISSFFDDVSTLLDIDTGAGVDAGATLLRSPSMPALFRDAKATDAGATAAAAAAFLLALEGPPPGVDFLMRHQAEAAKRCPKDALTLRPTPPMASIVTAFFPGHH
eukprot:TRINITY_DN51805_c0_g1_i1.p1 TRINITY_DN51805_c0_g1~~TRINITY_DN51805_c0_g1_i1.p1  ORF type:complete len:324 (+),score=83.30 TRINITY_DN51805_c0_g1_i1:222-1193(+)